MVKIYTKTGDDGTTGILGKRVSKGDEIIEVLGEIDELNSYIGVCRSEFTIQNLQFTILDKELKRIQGNLMGIAAMIAGGKSYEVGVMGKETKKLEKMIDKLTGEMPPLTNFIYPTGYLQAARSVCRRAERGIVRMYNVKFTIYNEKEKNAVLKYMNRLSDALFVMGRWVNFKQGLEEEVWKK